MKSTSTSKRMSRYKRREYIRERLKRLGVKVPITMPVRDMEARLKQLVVENL